ncbi:hypothetical protein ADEAN_000372800 [Angomonas deanei]|uniref:Uncharacterized protein n=1 Tax=Angomonas deanei TaxID=59799 RepID=A0A7G2CBG4_9TRYP|nr:hypothetical protein ADEAN_000372800 [Angomonas deanei]
MSKRNHSPSPDFDSVNSSRLYSMARSGTRATSEERSETVEGSPSPTSTAVTEASRAASEALAAARNSRAASEVRADDVIRAPYDTQSARSSRAGSEVPDRGDLHEPLSTRSSRAGSEAPQRFDGLNDSLRSSRAGSEAPDRATPPPNPGSPKRAQGKKLIPHPPSTSKMASTAAPTPIRSYGNIHVEERIEEVERVLYNTTSATSGTYCYYQSLHYPLETEKPEVSAVPTQTSGSSASATLSSKEPSPAPRLSGSSDLSNSNTSPSPSFDGDTFNANYEGGNEFLSEAGEVLSSSFSVPLQGEEPLQPAVSVLALTTLPDPISGAPVLSVCLGDYSGHIEYFEVGVRDKDNKRIKKSKSLAKSKSRPSAQLHRDANSEGREFLSMESKATENIVNDMRGREVARRHSHKAYIKTINALTSVAVEPGVKCLQFVRPYSSPSTISYLTANERVIKLFHVRRDGFTPFSVFPDMADVIGKTFMGSRFFARLPPQPTILPIREYGPSQNCIQALSMSADNETFMSVEDLQVFWWHLESNDPTKATCIADLRPPSGALDEVEELVTAASFHPTHSSLFMLSRSSGVLNIGDLRDPPSREEAHLCDYHPSHGGAESNQFPGI